MEANQVMDDQQSEQPGDAALGVEAIAIEFHGKLDKLPKKEREKKIRQMNHLLVTGAVPARKVGKFWIGSKRRLRQFIAGEGA
jgi:hypothetical protein